MSYKEFINNIIETRGRHGCGEQYHEKHHIIPRCLGGENKEENYIDLFAKEHFIAHRLLAKENPHNHKLQYAWWMMCYVKTSNQKRYKCTPEEYEEARIAFSEISKGKHHSEETKKKLSEANRGENNPFYGKKHTEETKKKLSEAMKGKYVGENSPNYGKHPSEETRKKMSTNHADISGRNNPMYGQHHTEEAKRKMSKAKEGKYNGKDNPMYGQHHTEETKRKMSKAKKGKNNVNAKPVYCPELDMTFNTIIEAQNYIGVTSGILQCCSPKYNRFTAGRHPQTKEKLHWEYINKYMFNN